jgi:hypothetical protein
MSDMSDDEFAAALGIEDSPAEPIVEDVVEEGVEEAPTSVAFLRDIDEDMAYTALQHARNMPEKLTAFRDQAFGKMGDLERQLKQLQATAAKSSGSALVDPEPIKKVLAGYDKALAESGLAEAIADAIKITPMDESSLSPFLSPMQEQFNRELVLSHYDAEELNSIVPPADEKGTLTPQTQRHKDFLEWYELQPLATQNALEVFGPQYVRALRKFEKWEGERHQEKVQSAGSKVQRLAGGQQPSGARRAGQRSGPQTAEEAFYQAWNEDD